MLAPLHADLFSGLGGFTQAAKNTGCRTIWANEIDPRAAATYAANHSSEMHQCDIADLLADDLQPPDILTAGFPCQPFSIAGQRRGTADSRGQLFPHILRLCQGWGDRRPGILLLENVPGLLSIDKGRTFRAMGDAIAAAGYSWGPKFMDSSQSWAVLDAIKCTPIPARRKRLYMIALRDDIFTGARPIQWPTEGDPATGIADWLMPETVEPCDTITPSTALHRRALAALRDHELCRIHHRPPRIRPSNHSPAITQHWGTGGGNIPLVIVYQKFHRAAVQDFTACQTAGPFSSSRNLVIAPKTYAGKVVQDAASCLMAHKNCAFDNLVAEPTHLRRLTVQECAGLMGLPPTWRWPDTVARTHRYRQLGNSVSVPMVELLLQECRRLLALRSTGTPTP